MSKLPGKIFSENLIFCKPSMDHLKLWYHAITSSLPELRPSLRWRSKTYTREECADKLRQFIADFDHDRGEYVYFMFDFKDLDYIGCISLHNIDSKSHTAELGYWIARGMGVRGYAAEAVLVMEQVAIDRLGIKSVKVKFKVHNPKKMQAALKEGFVLSEDVSIYDIMTPEGE